MQVQRKDKHLSEAIELLDRHIETAKGNPRLAYSYLNRTELEFVDQEILSCLNFRYYAENYHVIKSEEEGLKCLYPWWESQEILYSYVLEDQEAGRPVKIFVLKARQEGISEISQAMLFHKTVFMEAVNTLVVAQDPPQADFLFGKSRTAYDRLPWWMKPEIRYEVAGLHMVFDRRNSFERGTDPGLNSMLMVEAANKMTGVSVGKNIRGGHFSEIAEWYNPGIFSQQIRPALNASDMLAICESTAKGRTGLWYNLYKAAKEGKIDWRPVFIEFFRVKKYFLPIPKTVPFELTEDEKSLRAKVEREAKHTLSDGQIYWRRQRIQEFIAEDGEEYNFYSQYPCLVGETRISTDQGIVNIVDAKEGMVTESGRITGFFPKGLKPTFELKTKMGYRIVGTEDHLVSTASGFSPLGKSVGKIIELRPPRFAERLHEETWKDICGMTSSILVDEDFARFLGYFMGDGSYCSNAVSIACTGKDVDVQDDVRRLMVKFFGVVHSRILGKNKGCVELRVGCRDFKNVMIRLGIWNPNGRPHRWVCVPDCIKRSPKYIVREFLRGLFESDGFNAYHTVQVGMFSKHVEFLRDVQFLLLGFNITCTLRTGKKKLNKFGREYNANTLHLGSAAARLFNRDIGFISNRKRSHSKSVGLEKLGRPQYAIVMFDTVCEITPVGDRQVYDISVEGAHVFTANGILVHNCTWMEAFQASGASCFNRRKLQHQLEANCLPPVYYGEIDLEIENGRPRPSLRLTKVAPGGFVPPAENRGSRLYIWELPEDGVTYYIGGDPAKGIQGRNFSAGEIWKIGKGALPNVQVAEWHGWINPTPFGDVLAALGYYYRRAEISCEFNNDVGEAANHQLMRVREYPNLFRWKHVDKVKNFVTDFFGWYTTRKSRGRLITKWKEAIDDNTVIIRSERLLDECLNFTEEGDTEDDCLFASMICLYCAHDMDWGEDKRASETGDDDEDDAPENKYKKLITWCNTDYSPTFDGPRKRGQKGSVSNLAELTAQRVMDVRSSSDGESHEDDWKLT